MASHGGMRLAREELRRLNVAVEPHADDGKLWFHTTLGLHALSTLKIPERVCVNVCNVPAPDAWYARAASTPPRDACLAAAAIEEMRSDAWPCRMLGTFA